MLLLFTHHCDKLAHATSELLSQACHRWPLQSKRERPIWHHEQALVSVWNPNCFCLAGNNYSSTTTNFVLWAKCDPPQHQYKSIAVETLIFYLNELTCVVEKTFPTSYRIVLPSFLFSHRLVEILTTSHFSAHIRLMPHVDFTVYFSALQKWREESYTADEHYAFLLFVLNVYNRTMDHFVAIVCDNGNRNKEFTGSVWLTFVGCHIHCFKIYVKKMLAYYSHVIAKVHNLMWKSW